MKVLPFVEPARQQTSEVFLKNMSELYCNRYSSRCLVMLIVGALSTIISVRAALWQCGKPSTFNSPTGVEVCRIHDFAL